MHDAGGSRGRAPVEHADPPEPRRRLMNTGPATATVGGAAIVSAIISLVTMYAQGTIDVASATTAIGVIFAGINSLFSHTV